MFGSNLAAVHFNTALALPGGTFGSNLAAAHFRIKLVLPGATFGWNLHTAHFRTEAPLLEATCGSNLHTAHFWTQIPLLGATFASNPAWPECAAAHAAICGDDTQSQVSSPPKPKYASGNSGEISETTFWITSKVASFETSACEKLDW